MAKEITIARSGGAKAENVVRRRAGGRENPLYGAPSTWPQDVQEALKGLKKSSYNGGKNDRLLNLGNGNRLTYGESTPKGGGHGFWVSIINRKGQTINPNTGEWDYGWDFDYKTTSAMAKGIKELRRKYGKG